VAQAPYRDVPEALATTAPASLECWLRDGDSKRWLRAVYVKVWFGLFGSLMLAPAGLPIALLPVVLGGVWAWHDVRQRKGARVLLHVAKGRLNVACDKTTFDVTLDNLLEVRMDSKSASKNVTMARADGVNTVFGMGSSHNIDIDVARIELVTKGNKAHLLSEDFISVSLCTDSLRAIRLFLRAHGWQPDDERPPGQRQLR
jgi:hypothetical protein